MSERYTHLDSIKVDGIASTSQQGALIGASKVMPQPSADLDGVTIQYMGPTDSTYTFKRMYTCAMVGSEYKWIDATPVDIVQNSNGVFIAGTEIGVADSTKYGVMSPDQAEKVESSFVKLETVTEGAEPNKVDIIRVEGTPLQVSGVDKSVNITRNSLGLGDSAQLDVGTLEGQIPVLGANGQLPKSTIPPYATGTYVGSVRTKALLTSLTTAEIGDWAKVTSDDDFNNNGAYILNGTAPGVLTNWVQMVGPANVESVNGKSGRVVLDKEDIGLANVDNTSDAKKPISEATQSALNDCVKLSGSDSAQVIAKGGLQLPNGDLSVGGGALIGKDTEPALLRVRGSIEATQGISGALVQTENVASDDSSTKVASTAWVNGASTVVHTTGNEDIAGIKRFLGAINLQGGWKSIGFYDKIVSIGTPVTLSYYRPLSLIAYDVDNKELGGFEINTSQTGTIISSVVANNKKSDGTKISGNIRVAVKLDGDVYATAPSTKDTHPDNAIVTKKYLLDKIAFSKQPYVVAYNPAVAITNPTSCITYQGRCASYVKPAMSNNVLDRGSWTDDEPLLKRIQYCTFRPDGTIKEVLYKNDLTKVWIKNFAENVPDTPIYTNDELMQYCATLTQPSEIPPDAAESSIITLDTMVVIPTLYTYGDERGFRISLDPSQGEAEAHTIDGEVCKYIAIGVYLGTVKDDKLMSVSQAEPLRSTSRYNFRAKLIGKDETHGKWRLLNYWDSRLLKMLTVLIGGSMNGQATFGNGLVTAMGVDSTSTTDKWTRNYATYTGKTDKVGMFGQSAEFTQKFDVDAYGKYDNGSTVVNRQVKCLVEAPWGQCWQFADDHCNEPSTGRLFAGKNSAKVIHPLDNNDGQYFTNQVASPTLIEHICTITDSTDGLPGLLTEVKEAYSDVIHTESAAWGLPAVKTGSSSTGTCDGWWMLSRSSEGVKNNIVGGGSSSVSSCGPFTWRDLSTLSWASVNIGARLVFVFN